MSILNMLYWSGSWWYAIYDLSLTNDDTNEKVIVKWFEYMPANWVKTVVRYKTGSAPTSPTDWTLAVQETTKNQYSSTGYWVSWLSDNTTYYFSVFAIDSNGTIINVQNGQIKTEFWWKPWSNTLLYLPLESDTNDHSWNSYTITQNWAVTKWDIWYYFNWGYLVTPSFIWPTTYTTISIWVKPNWISSLFQAIFSKYYWSLDFPYITINVYIPENTSNWSFQVTNSSKNVVSSDSSLSMWNWQNIIWVYDWSKVYFYKNWVLASSASQSWNIYSNNTQLSIGNFLWNLNQPYYGYISECIFENIARTPEQVAWYYNKTKSHYWL